MNNVCGNCKNWGNRLDGGGGWCNLLMHYFPSDGSCSKWVTYERCEKPTDAASVLMSLLIKQVTELQSKVQDLSLKMDIMNVRLDNHVDDRDRHLRQPGKYTAHNLFM